MRWTLKEVLKQTRIALKKMISKRDKWMKEWPGQVLPSLTDLLQYFGVDESIILVLVARNSAPLGLKSAVLWD